MLAGVVGGYFIFWADEPESEQTSSVEISTPSQVGTENTVDPVPTPNASAHDPGKSSTHYALDKLNWQSAVDSTNIAGHPLSSSRRQLVKKALGVLFDGLEKHAAKSGSKPKGHSFYFAFNAKVKRGGFEIGWGDKPIPFPFEESKYLGYLTKIGVKCGVSRKIGLPDLFPKLMANCQYRGHVSIEELAHSVS